MKIRFVTCGQRTEQKRPLERHPNDVWKSILVELPCENETLHVDSCGNFHFSSASHLRK